MLFNKMGVKLFYSMTYHPQTNGLSERTNQTFKIALQFFVHAFQDLSFWSEILFYI